MAYEPPRLSPHEPFLLGVGVVFNLLTGSSRTSSESLQVKAEGWSIPWTEIAILFGNLALNYFLKACSPSVKREAATGMDISEMGVKLCVTCE